MCVLQCFMCVCSREHYTAFAPGSPGSTESTEAPSSTQSKIKRSPSILKTSSTPSAKLALQDKSEHQKLKRAQRVPTMSWEEAEAEDEEKRKRDERNEKNGVKTMKRCPNPKGKSAKAKAKARAGSKTKTKQAKAKAAKAKNKKKTAAAKKKGASAKHKKAARKPKQSTAEVLRQGAAKQNAAKVAAAKSDEDADAASTPVPARRMRCKTPDKHAGGQTPSRTDLISKTSSRTSLSSKTPSRTDLSSKTPSQTDRSSKTPGKVVKLSPPGDNNETCEPEDTESGPRTMPRSLSTSVLEALKRASTADKLPDERLPELADGDDEMDDASRRGKHNKKNKFYRSLVRTLIAILFLLPRFAVECMSL